MKAHILNTTPCTVPNSIYFSTHTRKNREFNSQSHFCLVSDQGKPCRKHIFISKKIEKVLCYYNNSDRCRCCLQLLTISCSVLCIPLTARPWNMQILVNLMLTAAPVVPFRFLLKQPCCFSIGMISKCERNTRYR